MARLDLEVLLRPISDEQPCGPDLEAEFDPDYQGFVAASAGLLPSSFFKPRADGSGSDAVYLKNSDTEVAGAFNQIADLCERTRDLRLVVRQAKLLALCRDIGQFSATTVAAADLIETFWRDVHPQAEEENDYFVRVQTVQSIDDTPHVILPLQHAALIEADRGTSYSYRSWLLANGKIEPRQGEDRPDAGAVTRAFEQAELDAVVARRDQFSAIVSAVERIDSVSVEHGGYENRIRLDKLRELAAGVAGFLDGIVAGRDPSRAHVFSGEVVQSESEPGQPSGGGAPAAGGAAPTIPDRAHAAAHLRGACLYFETFEPSSPAVLLLRFAEGLIGKPFYEMMRIMMPNYAARAGIGVGSNAFRLVVEKVAEKLEPRPAAAASAGDAPVPEIVTRQKALEAMDGVAAFLRKSEPASPIPLLVARARDLAERDFASLINDLFSAAVLKNMREES